MSINPLQISTANWIKLEIDQRTKFPIDPTSSFFLIDTTTPSLKLIDRITGCYVCSITRLLTDKTGYYIFDKISSLFIDPETTYTIDYLGNSVTLKTFYNLNTPTTPLRSHVKKIKQSESTGLLGLIDLKVFKLIEIEKSKLMKPLSIKSPHIEEIYEDDHTIEEITKEEPAAESYESYDSYDHTIKITKKEPAASLHGTTTLASSIRFFKSSNEEIINIKDLFNTKSNIMKKITIAKSVEIWVNPSIPKETAATIYSKLSKQTYIIEEQRFSEAQIIEYHDIMPEDLLPLILHPNYSTYLKTVTKTKKNGTTEDEETRVLLFKKDNRPIRMAEAVIIHNKSKKTTLCKTLIHLGSKEISISELDLYFKTEPKPETEELPIQLIDKNLMFNFDSNLNIHFNKDEKKFIFFKVN